MWYTDSAKRIAELRNTLLPTRTSGAERPAANDAKIGDQHVADDGTLEMFVDGEWKRSARKPEHAPAQRGTGKVVCYTEAEWAALHPDTGEPKEEPIGEVGPR